MIEWLIFCYYIPWHLRIFYSYRDVRSPFQCCSASSVFEKGWIFIVPQEFHLRIHYIFFLDIPIICFLFRSYGLLRVWTFGLCLVCTAGRGPYRPTPTKNFEGLSDLRLTRGNDDIYQSGFLLISNKRLFRDYNIFVFENTV